MINKFILAIATCGIVLINLFPFQNSKAEENKAKRWKLIWCDINRTSSYEVCQIDGDGNQCYNGGAISRSCPSNPN